MYNGDYMNIIELLKYIFLGFIQGITEPIPVSSSGHLLIAKVLMERCFGDITIDYDLLAIITNFGSLIAIIASCSEALILRAGFMLSLIESLSAR